MAPASDEDGLLVAPLVAGDEQLGILLLRRPRPPVRDEDAELLRAVANQTAVGLKKAELIERLTAENIVKDMFEALAAGSVETAEAKAGDARCDLSRPHLFLHAERAARPARRLAVARARRARAGAPRARSTRARSSTPGTTGCARSCRCRPPAPRRRALAQAWTSSPARRALDVG